MAAVIPHAARHVVVGAGVHGLSTAWHLAGALRARGQDTPDVVVLDKSGIGAGASGIACGVVRNNYFQPAMRRLMAHSVALWESDPVALAYHPVGYLQVGPEAMRAGVAQVHAEQQAIGYPSTIVDGADATRTYLHELLGDWRADRVIVTENAVDFAQATACTVLLVRKEWWPSKGIAAPLADSVDRWARDHPDPGHWAHWLDATYR
jgi:glycine/D-amino acid oxidase-like deaminating enzyme